MKVGPVVKGGRPGEGRKEDLGVQGRMYKKENTWPKRTFAVANDVDNIGHDGVLLFVVKGKD